MPIGHAFVTAIQSRLGHPVFRGILLFWSRRSERGSAPWVCGSGIRVGGAIVGERGHPVAIDRESPSDTMPTGRSVSRSDSLGTADLADGAVDVVSSGERPYDQVAVGDQAAEVAVVGDQDITDVRVTRAGHRPETRGDVQVGRTVEPPGYSGFGWYGSRWGGQPLASVAMGPHPPGVLLVLGV
ncbi:hypothetical protein [Kitasatospora sp. NPDC056531]|uniref:hypothetical protein n=1 Tax=Kitasatospora sp. NPDC056531 TaxID=3345856 RepID=UPI0036BC3B01